MADLNWYKGNLHTHTTKSDGDADPEIVVEWYKKHGYDFLVLSDHNHRTILEHEDVDGPMMVPGEEVSARISGGGVPIHLNGIGISRVVEPTDAGGVVQTLQANIDAILDAGGIAQLNHPNGAWAFDQEEIVQVQGASLLEVYNGWPGANSEGGPGKHSAEEIWDGVLSAGKVIFGVATDDAHHYSDFSHVMANPGRGWVMVEAEELTQDTIIESLQTGRFYFSTGINLARIEMSENLVSLEIVQDRDYVYQTRFIGRDGVMLSEGDGLEASYDIGGDEGYVRASVLSSYGTRAWTQPIFIPVWTATT
jgi:hypothetical protein